MADAQTEFQTLIGPDAQFKGELSFESDGRISGSFEGRVRTPGTLHIADGARVAADIEAGVLRVDGELKGNVVVNEKLTLSATARMEGDLRTSRLEMDDGAVFVGNVQVGRTGAAETPRRERPVAARADGPTLRVRGNGDGPTISVPPLNVASR